MMLENLSFLYRDEYCSIINTMLPISSIDISSALWSPTSPIYTFKVDDEKQDVRLTSEL